MTRAFATPPKSFRARVVMTRSDHVSGTDRVAEAASTSTAQIIVNIQGDEPMLDPAAIDTAVLGLLEHDEIPMGTLKKLIEDPAEIGDPNVVKVVTDHQNNALYFSRSPIPYFRENAAPAVLLQAHWTLCLPPRLSALRLSRPPRRASLEQAERLRNNCAPSKTDSGYA